ncbi:hypothetical protein CEE45_00365 [Candidatus Heimdallarchaeota archaeon B3_Heim]|nr:MAG: hypothetical protein CEE45_00365 [Candidatus Heimdallarchaeota archaeon B3_Heim]
MKAMLLRIGIDKGTDGALAPIFNDGSFEYIPISEKKESAENRTFITTIGRSGKFLSDYLPKKVASRKFHFDPEFETFTYGDPTSKRNYLVNLIENDLLVFYAGLTPYKTNKYKEALYIIGYFTVDKVIDFSQTNRSVAKSHHKLFSNNAHIKRSHHSKDLIIVIGKKGNSRLLEEAVLISKPKLNKIGRIYHTVSPDMETLLGISGSIQRSIPPRLIKDEKNITNLKRLLNIT